LGWGRVIDSPFYAIVSQFAQELYRLLHIILGYAYRENSVFHATISRYGILFDFIIRYNINKKFGLFE